MRMKVGVFTVLFQTQEFPRALDYIVESGVEAVEIGTGGYPGTTHADPKELLANPRSLKSFRDQIEGRGLEISGLSCHGNPVHPQAEVAAAFQADFRNTVLLAEQLGVSRVITFSGCPGDHDGARYPNWVTCPWPDDFLRVLDYQWNDKLIPYWEQAVRFAVDHGVNQICLEMHPGFCVYNPETLLRLRAAVGAAIGANYDPSHLFWQGIDPVASLRQLGEAVYHFHAKDCRLDESNTRVNGVLDTKPYSDEIHRSWIFRTIGYGHGPEVWKDIVSNLAMIGYDGVLSIEHEDSLMSVNEGFQKAVRFLKEVIRSEKPGAMWWA